MDLTITKYGDYEVTLANGAKLRINEARSGRLEVRALEGHLAIHPQSSNALEIAAVDWDGKEVGQ
jgi:hypothetical protein